MLCDVEFTYSTVHVDLLGLYNMSPKRQHLCGAIINKDVSLTYMTMIYPEMGWFKIIEVPTYNLDGFMGFNDEYIYKSSTRVCHLFNNTWLSRHLRPLKVVFDNRCEFK